VGRTKTLTIHGSSCLSVLSRWPSGSDSLSATDRLMGILLPPSLTQPYLESEQKFLDILEARMMMKLQSNVRSDGKSTTKNNKINRWRHEDLTWKTPPVWKGKTTSASQQIFTISGVCLQCLTATYKRNNQTRSKP